MNDATTLPGLSTGLQRATFTVANPNSLSIVPANVAGYVWTPNLPGRNERVLILLDEADTRMLLDAGFFTGTKSATNLLTGQKVELKRTACGLGCRCGMEIV